MGGIGGRRGIVDTRWVREIEGIGKMGGTREMRRIGKTGGIKMGEIEEIRKVRRWIKKDLGA